MKIEINMTDDPEDDDNSEHGCKEIAYMTVTHGVTGAEPVCSANKINNRFCLLCGGIIINKNIYKKSKYHKDCWLKCSGGIRNGSSRGKHGWYKGFWCDSSYELAWIIYNLDHGIKFQRNKIGFDYIYKNKKHKFYPDFIIENGLYIEIKNYKSALTDAKMNQFPYKIKIMYKQDVFREIMPYVIHNHGKNFIELYENNPYKIKKNQCIKCGSPAKNKLCSRKCSGEYMQMNRIKKLNKEIIIEVKKMYELGYVQKDIGKKFNIHQVTVSSIITGKISTDCKYLWNRGSTPT